MTWLESMRTELKALGPSAEAPCAAARFVPRCGMLVAMLRRLLCIFEAMLRDDWVLNEECLAILHRGYSILEMLPTG